MTTKTPIIATHRRPSRCRHQVCPKRRQSHNLLLPRHLRHLLNLSMVRSNRLLRTIMRVYPYSQQLQERNRSFWLLFRESQNHQKVCYMNSSAIVHRTEFQTLGRSAPSRQSTSTANVAPASQSTRRPQATGTQSRSNGASNQADTDDSDSDVPPPLVPLRPSY